MAALTLQIVALANDTAIAECVADQLTASTAVSLASVGAICDSPSGTSAGGNELIWQAGRRRVACEPRALDGTDRPVGTSQSHAHRQRWILGSGRTITHETIADDPALVLIALSVLVRRMPASVLRCSCRRTRYGWCNCIASTARCGVAAPLSPTGVPPRCPLPGLSAAVGGRSASGCELGDAAAGKRRAERRHLRGGSRTTDHDPALRVTCGRTGRCPITRVVADVVAATLARDRLVVKGNLRGQDAAYRSATPTSPRAKSARIARLRQLVADGSVCTLANRGGSARIDGRLQLAPRAVTGSVELTPAGG